MGLSPLYLSVNHCGLVWNETSTKTSCCLTERPRKADKYCNTLMSLCVTEQSHIQSQSRVCVSVWDLESAPRQVLKSNQHKLRLAARRHKSGFPPSGIYFENTLVVWKPAEPHVCFNSPLEMTQSDFWISWQIRNDLPIVTDGVNRLCTSLQHASEGRRCTQCIYYCLINLVTPTSLYLSLQQSFAFANEGITSAQPLNLKLTD